MKQLITTLLVLTGIATPAIAQQNCKEDLSKCPTLTAESICAWSRTHPIDRESLDENDLQAVIYDSCIYLSRIECAYIGQTTVKLYKTVFDGFTGDGRKDKPTIVGFQGKAPATELNPNIFTNFRALQNKHNVAFKKVEILQADFLKVINEIKSDDAANQARIALRDKIKEINTLFYQSSYYDSIFISVLDDAAGQLESIGTSAAVIASDNNCKVSLSSSPAAFRLDPIYDRTM